MPAKLAAAFVFALLLHSISLGIEVVAQHEVITNYRKHIAGGANVTAWYGKRVAIVLDNDPVPTQREPAVMTEIVQTFDNIFDAYDRVTGRKPRLASPLKGRIRVEVSKQIGGGRANHGTLGVAVGDRFFENLYRRVKRGEKTYDQIYFYEIARNYWMQDMNPRIDYHTSAGPQDYGWWTVGFNNAMSVILPMEIEGVDDMYYFGKNSEMFAKGMEKNLNVYIAGKDKYTWENSWNVRLLPWKQNSSLNDLMTGLLVRLAKDHGGTKFIEGLYREIPKLEPLESLSDYQGARDNFYIACSRAAGKDLRHFFERTLRWEITPKLR